MGRAPEWVVPQSGSFPRVGRSPEWGVTEGQVPGGKIFWTAEVSSLTISGFMPEAEWGHAKVRASTWLHENEMSMSFWTPGWGEKEMPISE